MEINVIVALIGILGGLIGAVASAFVQYLLGKRSNKSNKELEIRSQSYMDFVNAVSDLAASAKKDKGVTRGQLSKLTQAKSRIALIGSPEVVKEINRFFDQYGVLDSDESCY